VETTTLMTRIQHILVNIIIAQFRQENFD